MVVFHVSQTASPNLYGRCDYLGRCCKSSLGPGEAEEAPVGGEGGQAGELAEEGGGAGVGGEGDGEDVQGGAGGQEGGRHQRAVAEPRVAEEIGGGTAAAVDQHYQGQAGLGGTSYLCFFSSQMICK